MRRGHGVSAVKNRLNEKKAYSAVGKVIQDNKISHVEDLITNFKTSLEDFASKHKDRINSDPEFRHQFHVMCKSIGVDPLASNKGFWSDLLGVGDFYYELGVQIVQICLATRRINGGIISLAELRDRIRHSKSRNRQNTSDDDIKRAVEKLSVLGSGFQIIEATGRTIVVSVPLELSTDHQDILNLANEHGFVTASMCSEVKGWSSARFQGSINVLLKEGMAWIDIHNGEVRYYFPSIWKETSSMSSV